MKDPDIISDTREIQQNSISDKPKANNSLNLSPLLLSNTSDFSPNLFTGKVNVLKCNNQIKELHTVLRDR
jgi:hypothetical protein